MRTQTLLLHSRRASRNSDKSALDFEDSVVAAVGDEHRSILADRDAQLAWLDGGLDAEDALELCASLPTSRLSAVPANPAVNKAGGANEGPELLRAPGQL